MFICQRLKNSAAIVDVQHAPLPIYTFMGVFAAVLLAQCIHNATTIDWVTSAVVCSGGELYYSVVVVLALWWFQVDFSRIRNIKNFPSHRKRQEECKKKSRTFPKYLRIYSYLYCKNPCSISMYYLYNIYCMDAELC